MDTEVDAEAENLLVVDASVWQINYSPKSKKYRSNRTEFGSRVESIRIAIRGCGVFYQHDEPRVFVSDQRLKCQR
jgi:hypothetical protein